MRALGVVLLLALGPASADTSTGPAVAISNGGRPFAGDHRALTTISPNGDGYRDTLRLRFRVDRPTKVRVTIAAHRYKARLVYSRTLRLRRGRHLVVWRPRATIPPRTYTVRISADAAPLRVTSVRVLGIDATFERESYRRNTAAGLLLESDEPLLTLRILRAGTTSVDPLGAPVSDPVRIERTDRRDGPRRLRVWVGDWPSGLYFAELRAPDGRTGYAPFVLRPDRGGEHDVAVVLPTYTWQAYNFRDADGDGRGDTWYAARRDHVRLGRPYLDRGLPPFFRRYDLPFLRWLVREAEQEREADVLADSDLAAFRNGAALARAYDLVIFPGHHEYVTTHAFDVVQGFRDRGGSLMFLSANNFFWQVERKGRTLVRTRRWRMLGRPESRLIGVQYVASDQGERRAPYRVRSTRHDEWFLRGTGLRPGSRFGTFGIEIDRTTSASPRGTTVLAEIPHLFGRGRTAQMTYYETRRGARVFAAGAFTLAGQALTQPVSALLDNLWTRMAFSRDRRGRSVRAAAVRPSRARARVRGSRTRSEDRP